MSCICFCTDPYTVWLEIIGSCCDIPCYRRERYRNLLPVLLSPIYRSTTILFRYFIPAFSADQSTILGVISYSISWLRQRQNTKTFLSLLRSHEGFVVLELDLVKEIIDFSLHLHMSPMCIVIIGILPIWCRMFHCLLSSRNVLPLRNGL